MKLRFWKRKIQVFRAVNNKWTSRDFFISHSIHYNVISSTAATCPHSNLNINYSWTWVKKLLMENVESDDIMRIDFIVFGVRCHCPSKRFSAAHGATWVVYFPVTNSKSFAFMIAKDRAPKSQKSFPHRYAAGASKLDEVFSFHWHQRVLSRSALPKPRSQPIK